MDRRTPRPVGRLRESSRQGLLAALLIAAIVAIVFYSLWLDHH